MLLTPVIPFNANAQFSATAFWYQVPPVTGTNFYYDVVFVNTNFSNTNMSATAWALSKGGEEVQMRERHGACGRQNALK